MSTTQSIKTIWLWVEYSSALQEIKQTIIHKQYEAMKVVNTQLISLYRYLWEKITLLQKEHSRWDAFVPQMSRDLQFFFPGIRGFSVRNLSYMRDFYNSYNRNVILQPMVAKISRTKNIIILTQCKDDLEIEFYIRMTRKFGWTKAVLMNHVDNKSYQKHLINQTSFDHTLSQKYAEQAKLAVKDEYMFDFLELWDEHSEKELEQAITLHIKKFLSEFWWYFSFIWNQYRLEVWWKEFFVDILLFHRKLQCLVAIELKIGEFKPEYISKMNFYLSALDDNVRMDNENASIWIILCKEKDRTIVEYALRDTNKPIWVSQYTSHSTLPKDLEWLLPDYDSIVGFLQTIE